MNNIIGGERFQNSQHYARQLQHANGRNYNAASIAETGLYNDSMTFTFKVNESDSTTAWFSGAENFTTLFDKHKSATPTTKYFSSLYPGSLLNGSFSVIAQETTRTSEQSYTFSHSTMRPHPLDLMNDLLRRFGSQNEPEVAEILQNVTTSFYANDSEATTLNLYTTTGTSLDDTAARYWSDPVVQLTFWVYMVCFVIICVVGILGNIATIVIMTHHDMRSSINTYLAGLAVFDMCVLLLSLFIYPPQPYCVYARHIKLQHSNACKLLGYPLLAIYPLSLIAQCGSVWTCVAITCDRYIAVCYPLQTRSLCTVKRARIVIIVIALCATVFKFPAFFELKYDEIIGIAEPTSLRNNYYYRTIYYIYLYLFLMILIPLIIMVSVNAVIAKQIHQAYRDRRRMSGRDEKERRVTIMVIAVIVAFIVLNILAFVTNMLEAFAPQFRQRNFETFMILVVVANLCIALNSAVNFLIYCALGFRFRQMFLRIFLPCFYDPKKEYRFLSAYFVSGRSNVSETSGIICMKRYPSTRQARRVTSGQSDTQPQSTMLSHQKAENSGFSTPAFDFSQLNRTKRIQVT